MLLQARPCGAGQVGDRTGGAQEPSGVGACNLLEMVGCHLDELGMNLPSPKLVSIETIPTGFG